MDSATGHRLRGAADLDRRPGRHGGGGHLANNLLSIFDAVRFGICAGFWNLCVRISVHNVQTRRKKDTYQIWKYNGVVYLLFHARGSDQVPPATGDSSICSISL